jgi:hypothetical protein
MAHAIGPSLIMVACSDLVLQIPDEPSRLRMNAQSHHIEQQPQGPAQWRARRFKPHQQTNHAQVKNNTATNGQIRYLEKALVGLAASHLERLSTQQTNISSPLSGLAGISRLFHHHIPTKCRLQLIHTEQEPRAWSGKPLSAPIIKPTMPCTAYKQLRPPASSAPRRQTLPASPPRLQAAEPILQKQGAVLLQP